MYIRRLKLPRNPKRSFFLWGPRQVGKTTLLKQTYPQVEIINLLQSEERTLLQSRPEQLRERLEKKKIKFLLIDEIQKVPELLDEVHYLIEDKKKTFGLCGSSARKLKKQHANLLGGRAIRFELFGLSAIELAHDFDLVQVLNRGYLPSIYDDKNYQVLLKAYCSDYLKEEILEEGLIRRLPPFSRFLEAAAIGDTEVISFETFAMDCGVSATTIKAYFDILSDTLLGRFLPAYRRRPKRRQVVSPKFYFSDVGVVNHLAQRGEIKPKSELFGKAFENWVHHELSCYLSYENRVETLSYWRLTTQVEVDFIVGHMVCAIEAKATDRIHREHTRGLEELKVDYPQVKKRIIISLEKKSRLLESGIEILSVEDFIDELWSGKLF